MSLGYYLFDREFLGFFVRRVFRVVNVYVFSYEVVGKEIRW